MDGGERLAPHGGGVGMFQPRADAFDPEGETEVERMDEGEGCPTQRALGFRHTSHIPSPF